MVSSLMRPVYPESTVTGTAVGVAQPARGVRAAEVARLSREKTGTAAHVGTAVLDGPQTSLASLSGTVVVVAVHQVGPSATARLMVALAVVDRAAQKMSQTRRASMTGRAMA